MESHRPSLPDLSVAEQTPEETPPLSLEDLEDQWAALSCDSEGDFL